MDEQHVGTVNHGKKVSNFLYWHPGVVCAPGRGMPAPVGIGTQPALMDVEGASASTNRQEAPIIVEINGSQVTLTRQEAVAALRRLTTALSPAWFC